MGTFILRAGAVAVNTLPFLDNSGGSSTLASDSWPVAAGGNAVHFDYANFFNQPTDAPGQYLLRFDTDLTAIYIDGVPTDFASLPAGISIVTAVLHFHFDPNSNTPYSDNAHNGATVFGQFDALTESPAESGSSSGAPDFTFNHAAFATFVDLVNDGFGVRALLGLNSFAGIKVWVQGTYAIQNFQFTVSPNSQPVQTGTQVTVTSDINDPDHLQLDQLTDVEVTWNSVPTTATIVSATETELIFTIPDISGDQPGIVTISVDGNGVQFSGSVILGDLYTIYLQNAPGIYQLNPAVATDTLYNPDGGTIEVAIPNPFFETGFIGG